MFLDEIIAADHSHLELIAHDVSPIAAPV